MKLHLVLRIAESINDLSTLNYQKKLYNFRLIEGQEIVDHSMQFVTDSKYSILMNKL